MTAASTVRCPWCHTDLAPEDAKPIQFVRLPSAPDTDNMQCRDVIGCRRRQHALDEALDEELRSLGLHFLCKPT